MSTLRTFGLRTYAMLRTFVLRSFSGGSSSSPLPSGPSLRTFRMAGFSALRSFGSFVTFGHGTSAGRIVIVTGTHGGSGAVTESQHSLRLRFRSAFPTFPFYRRG